MNKPAEPFSSTYASNLPELLLQLNCSVMLSTFQAGKIIVLSPKQDETMVQLPRAFDSPMGIALKENYLGLATKDEVLVFRNDQRLAPTYPSQPETYSDLYLPRTCFYTGALDIHDLEFSQNRLIGVSSSFSCIVEMTQGYSFNPVWKPDFISELTPSDKCHLNGMALDQKEKIKYVTGFAATDKHQGWRETIPGNGILIDVEKNEIVLDGLQMPHSPNIYDGILYFLESASGSLCSFDPEKKEKKLIHKFPGFVRGMSKVGDYLFVAISKLRGNTSIFKDLDIAKEKIKSGFFVMHIPTSAIVADYKYDTSVDEIYDIQILLNQPRPGILNHQSEAHKMALSTPQTTFWGQRAE